MKRVILTACIVAVAAVATPAAAQKKTGDKHEFLGRFTDWEAHKARIGGEEVCYIASLPKKSEGKYTRRDETSVLVSHWPKRKVFGQVEVRAGYSYRKNSKVSFDSEKGKFTLWTNRDTAWAKNAAADKKIVAALKKGLKLTVIGYSTRGTKTTDTYSLKGFTKAYEKITDECK
jgi:invasion protein IalB